MQTFNSEKEKLGFLFLFNINWFAVRKKEGEKTKKYSIDVVIILLFISKVISTTSLRCCLWVRTKNINSKINSLALFTSSKECC